MGWLERIADEDFQCTVEKRPTATSCISTICYNGGCVSRKTATGLEYGTCDCDPGWQGPRCTECCSLPCQNGGECTIAGGYHFCNCLDTRYIGAHCDEFRPTTTFDISSLNLTEEVHVSSFWNRYTIGAVSSMGLVSILLIASLLIIPYILYKKRHIFILKMIYKFKKFEDDDSRMYDVFLSYRTRNDKDRRFVIRELLPGIEHMGFTTCIDQRDFLAGAAIAETIKIAIQESRRTIIVVSPAYIEGEWPEFEVQCAMSESLKKAHRIIPIIFEPIDNYQQNLSTTLAHILESITYIEWPQTKGDDNAKAEFWRRLKLSLPKKKDTAKKTEPLPNKNSVRFPILLSSRMNFADDQC